MVGSGGAYMGITYSIFQDISVCAFSIGCAVRHNIGDDYRTHSHAGCDTFYWVVVGQGSGPGVPTTKMEGIGIIGDTGV